MEGIEQASVGLGSESGVAVGLLTVERVAAVLGCHHQTVRKLLREGELQRVDIGGHGIRVTAGSVRDFIQRGGSSRCR